ncbi:MAG: hypothetical protein K2H97_02545 [Prevotella sp.]|nr:hypothetical protein [Prevotella sp.]
MNKTVFGLMMCAALGFAATSQAQDNEKADTTQRRLTIGGYGEAVMSRNFYSDHFNRYKFPDQHKNDPSHGRFDLPHVTVNLGYDFGHGWSMGMEIEFEHGGTESAVEMDADESGEYEAETEKGGEVALEQFWIQKSFSKALNIRAGEIVVPVGATNKYHMPTEFFTVYRPEGESSIFPCTWHQTGISLWGRLKDWRYEVQFLSGLDSERFGAESFVHYGATSSYEFKLANNYAGAIRIDNYSIPGLRLSASGYYGYTFNNTLKSHNAAKYDNCKGALAIGSFDFMLDRWNWVVRGNFDYAHLGDASLISTFNSSFPKHSLQDGSPSKRQPVAESAIAAGIEAGYNVFSQIEKLNSQYQKLYLFGRYEYYDAMASGANKDAYEWCRKNRFAVGVNYYPVKQVVIKGEYSYRKFRSAYNNEPSLNIGIAYTGWFL